MGAGIGTILNQGKSGLAAAQIGQNVTAKNISNVNTPGFSRQRAEMLSNDPESYGSLRVGGGVRVGAITRSNSDFLNRRIQEEQTVLGKHEGVADIYSQVEAIFKDESERGLTKSVNQFFNDLRTLSTQPDSMPLRAAVRESAQAITTNFRSVSDSLEQVVHDVDRRIEGHVSDVNDLTTKIARLNQQISSIESRSNGASANDERDSRDAAIKELAKHFDIQVTPTDNGMVTVSAGRMGPLVLGTESYSLRTERASDGPNTNTVRITLFNPDQASAPKDVTDKIDSGALGGFLEVRDTAIPRLQNKVDTLAYNLSQEINGTHRQGYGQDGQSGVNFFEGINGVKGAASMLSLSDSVKQDLSNIAAADAPFAGGDNRNLLRLTDLQDAKVFEGGKANFTDYTSSIVGSVGVEMRSANESLEMQRGLFDQLNTAREQLAGVSLDEEGMEMIRYQKAFDANAKMIQVADNMFDTILSLKRF